MGRRGQGVEDGEGRLPGPHVNAGGGKMACRACGELRAQLILFVAF